MTLLLPAALACEGVGAGAFELVVVLEAPEGFSAGAGAAAGVEGVKLLVGFFCVVFAFSVFSLDADGFDVTSPSLERGDARVKTCDRVGVIVLVGAFRVELALDDDGCKLEGED